MTEEEAQTKWCPFARGIHDNAANRMAYGSSGPEDKADENFDQYRGEMAAMYPCLGSACMAWRIAEVRHFDEFDRPVSATSRHATKEKALGGYCGLAGKP